MTRILFSFVTATALLLGGCAVTAQGRDPSSRLPSGDRIVTRSAAEQSQESEGNPPKVNTAKPEVQDAYWEKAYEEVYRSAEELQAQDERERRRGIVLATLRRGNPDRKELALTFDDGPHPNFTPRLLHVLRENEVKATFFVIGKMVERSPETLKLIASDGHLIGNHTFSHVTLTKIPNNMVTVEYRAANDIIEKTIGKRPSFCRPPGGDYDADVIKGATANGLTTVLWTDDPADYASPGTSVIEQRTLDRLSNGGIILLHDGVEQTIQILPQIIQYAKAKGFRFVTVDQLMKSRTTGSATSRSSSL